VIRRIPISGGKVIPFSFGPKGSEPGRANGYEVRLATIMPAADAHEVFYKFTLSTPPGAIVKRVQVEDVSEETEAFPLVDDQSPKIVANAWNADSATLHSGHTQLQWVYTITTTMRVYHFTITDSKDVKTEIYHVTGYPDFMKSIIRMKWGEKYE
jgi:hypothetical protein